MTGTKGKSKKERERKKGKSEQSPRHDTLSYLNVRDFGLQLDGGCRRSVDGSTDRWIWDVRCANACIVCVGVGLYELGCMGWVVRNGMSWLLEKKRVVS
jgi:hypothetical protein